MSLAGTWHLCGTYGTIPCHDIRESNWGRAPCHWQVRGIYAAHMGLFLVILMLS